MPSLWACRITSFLRIRQTKSTMHTHHAVSPYLWGVKAHTATSESTQFQTLYYILNCATTGIKSSEQRKKESSLLLLLLVFYFLKKSLRFQAGSISRWEGKEICLGKYIVEVLREPHGTTRDRTVLHKGLVSATTRMTLGPALSPVSWRSWNLQLPLLSFQNFSPTDHVGHHLSATTISELVLPQASVCKLSTTGIDSTGGFIPSIFSLQTLFPNPRHRHAGNHLLLLLTHRSLSRLQPNSLHGHAMGG